MLDTHFLSAAFLSFRFLGGFNVSGDKGEKVVQIYLIKRRLRGRQSATHLGFTITASLVFGKVASWIICAPCAVGNV